LLHNFLFNNQCENEALSHVAPRKIEDIEKKIAEKTAVDDFKLPALESGKKKGF